ncbi:hypothetical protein OUZ56_024058 [Daphnia magna]|uniref:Reverse transcriptase domain-containing protein n=1 Tax=Daphnia magna TaxID=35525 RepID=A0ABR0B0C4_9CRUS|nr:hypothetical protein OUZ56_024058 [Daphnia magna]
MTGDVMVSQPLVQCMGNAIVGEDFEKAYGLVNRNVLWKILEVAQWYSTGLLLIRLIAQILLNRVLLRKTSIDFSLSTNGFMFMSSSSDIIESNSDQLEKFIIPSTTAIDGHQFKCNNRIGIDGSNILKKIV